MYWVKGGRWELVGGFVELEPRIAEPSDGDGGGSMAWALSRARVELSAGAFLTDPDGWQRDIGTPSGLERFVLEPGGRDAVLQAYSKFVGSYPVSGVAAPDPDRPSEMEALAGLVRTFGPLSPVPGVVESAPARGLVNFRAVNLSDFRSDMEALVRAYRTVEEPSKDGEAARKMRVQLVFEQAKDFLTEASVAVRLTAGEIKYMNAAASLRCFLWLEILRRAGKPPKRTCVYCGEGFEDRAKRGRPPDYCEAHRTSLYREAFRQGKAPAGWLPISSGSSQRIAEV